VLVSSGSAVKNGNAVVNDTPQIWDGAQWHNTVTFIGLPLYPRMHVAPDSRVFMSGSNASTYLLDTAGTGTWTPLPGPGGLRPNGERQYGPSVMYEPDKVVYIGGGNDAGTDLPSAATDRIDLSADPQAWHVGPPRFTSPIRGCSGAAPGAARRDELPWDLGSRHIQPASNNERDAHRQLLQRCRQLDTDLQIRVTGPLRKIEQPLVAIRPHHR
jgi:hypothetical protein